VAEATAEGLRKVAEAINEPGGFEAVQLRVAQQYIPEFGKLAKASNTLVLPMAAGDISSMVAMATTVIKKIGDNGSGLRPIAGELQLSRRRVAESPEGCEFVHPRSSHIGAGSGMRQSEYLT